MSVLGFIPDGYTESGLLLEVPGLYPRVTFRFRPMLISERVEYYRAADKLNGLPLRRLAADVLAAKLCEWDLQDARGEPVPITAANALRLKARLFERLFTVVSTDEPPDSAPDRPPEEVDLDLQDTIRAAEQGRTVSDVREERQRKNS